MNQERSRKGEAPKDKGWSMFQDVYGGYRLEGKFLGQGATFRLGDFQFTYNQLKVITAMAENDDIHQAAEKLGISWQTVNGHLKKLRGLNPELKAHGFELADYIDHFRELGLLAEPVLPRLKHLAETFSNIKL